MTDITETERVALQNIASKNFEKRNKAIETISSIHNGDLYIKVSELLYSDDAILRNAVAEIMTKWGAKVLHILLEKTKDISSNQRLYAANILGDIKITQAVDALLALLPDEESNVRFAAAEAIGKIGSKEATIPLLHYLHSMNDNPWEQFPLILTLGQLGDERAVIPLLQLAGNEMLQQPVLQAISNISDEHAIPYLLEVLKSSDSVMQNMAILAIKNLREKIKKYQIGEENFNLLIQKQFADVVPEDLKLITANLKNSLNEDYTIKLGAIFLLGLTNDPEALNVLISAYSTDLAPEIEEALLNLGKTNSANLIEILKIEDLTCREIIIRLLGQLKIDSALEEIIKHLKHPLPEIRSEAACALGQLLNSDTIPELIKLLQDSSIDVQNSAVTSLQAFDKNLVLPLLNQVKKKTADLEILISKIIAGLNPLVDIKEILKFANSEEFQVRRIVAQALKNYPDEEAAETLLIFLSDSHFQVREEAIRSLEDRGEKITDALISVLKDQAPWVRYCAAKALGKQKVSKKISNSLAELLNDPIPFVQIAAIESLGNLKTEHYSNRLLEFVSNHDSDISQAAIIALSNLKLESVAIGFELQNLLEKQIENPDWIVRKAIATAFGKIKTKNAFDLLLRMLAQETDNLVNSEILSSLGKLPDSKKIIPLLINFTSDSDLRENSLDVLTKLGSKIIPFLQQALENDDVNVRVNIVSILAGIKDDIIIPILVKLASGDSSPNVRKQSVLALNNFTQDQRAIWAIMWAANHDSDSLVMQTAKALLVS